jgi:hypothetical protein
MTTWEAGQELIACADQIADSEKDLRDAGFVELAAMLHECRLIIGDRFNQLGSHNFGLPDHEKGGGR